LASAVPTQYFSIAYDNGFACELRTTAFIMGKIIYSDTQHSDSAKWSFSPRHGTGAECINSTFMDRLLHTTGQQDCKQGITHDDDGYRKKNPHFI
jgi:hypothetical protein